MTSLITFFKKHLRFSVISLLLLFLAAIVLNKYSTTIANAAGSYVAFEVEDGAITSPATSINDASASSGHAVTLGTAASIACSGVSLSPSDDIQAELDANPTGTTFCFQAGTYRLTSPLNPKDNQSLIGAYGTILNGAQIVTGWSASGSNFVADSASTTAQQGFGTCTVTGCDMTQDVFLDNQHLTRVTALTDLAAGKFYQDTGTGKVYLRDNPTGHTVEMAVAPALINSDSTGVTVKNFIIEKAASAIQNGALESTNTNADWTVENNEFRYNHSIGLYPLGASIVRNNYVHHQGAMGVFTNYDDGVWEANEVSFNNIDGVDPLWSAGGSKFARTNNLTVRGNYFHDNTGPGIWYDINNNNGLIENNVSVRNYGKGIFYEISYNGIIRNNIVMDNPEECAFSFYCGAQILVSASPGVEVYGNTVRGHYGIGLLQQDRSDSPNLLGAHIVQNAYVHDNTITSTGTSSIAGGITDTGDDSIFTSRNNRFQNNHYHLGNLTTQYFDWLDDDHPILEWQGDGMDTTGTFDTNVASNSAPVLPLSVGPITSTSSAAVTTTVNVPTTGTYRVWSRLLTPDAVNDSYMLQVDNGPLLNVGDGSITANTWTWVDYRNGDTNDTVDLDLTSGTHTVKIFSRGSGVKIDRVILTTDTTCTPTGTGENCAPTSTQGSNTSGSSSSPSSPSAPTCGDSMPNSKPDLFQIDVNNTQAILYFSPAVNANKYFITYGNGDSVSQYGVEFDTGISTGVLSYTINSLVPNTTYSFMVLGGNGCMPGDWGNRMQIKTSNSAKSGTSSYKNFASKVLSIFPRQVTNVGNDTQ